MVVTIREEASPRCKNPIILFIVVVTIREEASPRVKILLYCSSWLSLSGRRPVLRVRMPKIQNPIRCGRHNQGGGQT